MADTVGPRTDELGKEASHEIAWDFNIPLLTNPFILLDMVKVLTIGFVSISVLFMLIGISQGVDEFLDMLRLIPMFGVCVLVIGVIFVFVMLVFYANRFPCRFTVSGKGVKYEVTSTQRKLNTVVIVLGALAGKPGVAGSGFLARSQESMLFSWKDIHRADLFPRRRVVCIRNSWRTLLRVYCTPENYEAVADMIRDGVERAEPQRKRSIASARGERSTLLKRMAWWPWIVLSALLSTAQPLLDERFIAIWVTAATLVLGAVFSGPARRTMGAIGLIASAATVVVVIANGLKVTSMAGGFVRWDGFDSATDSQDLPLFIIGCVGMLGLLVIALCQTATRTRE